jgi:hypothetical protein
MKRSRHYTPSVVQRQQRLPFSEPRAQTGASAVITCPYCRYTGPLLWIHGHGQCPNCKNVLEECCTGEQATPGWHELG